jgi:hypothetical protein
LNEKNKENIRLTVGGIVFGFGVLTVIGGFCLASLDAGLYLMMEICGAVLVLAGMTPFVRKFQRSGDGEETDGGFFRKYFGYFRPHRDYVEAEIIGITRNFRTAEGEREQFYVLCRYRDPSNQRTETFTSRALDRYPGSDIIGKKVRVIFHSENPEDYTVDLNSIQ